MDNGKFTVIDKPFVDGNFQEIPENKNLVKLFIEKTSDESVVHDILIDVNNLDMVPTAVFFSLKKRINANFTVRLGDFKGADFLHSFLKNSHVNEVVRQ
jgi:hypothetical protein